MHFRSTLFPCAAAADERHDLAVLDPERDALEDLGAVERHVKILDLYHRAAYHITEVRK